MRIKKPFIAGLFLFSMIFLSHSYAMDSADLSRISSRIAGRAEILKERVELFLDEPSSKTPHLYYLIISFLEDIHYLYMLGDVESAQKKLFVLDTVTYDLITTGCSTALVVNDAVGKLQASSYAGSMKEFKALVEANLGIISQRGLEASICFTQSEDAYMAANFNKLLSLRTNLQSFNSPADVKKVFDSFEFYGDVAIRHEIPDSLSPPETGFVLSLDFVNDTAVNVVVMFEGQQVPRLSLLLAVSKVLSYFTGIQTHNNESYESQFHYLLLEMRYLDWIEKNKTKFSLNDDAQMKKIIHWYRASYEGLANDSFVPRYYDQLLAGKMPPSLNRVSFTLNSNFYNEPGKKRTRADDYVFCMQGNRSQIEPDNKVTEFFDATSHAFPDGTVYFLGCGEGRNIPAAFKNRENIRKIIAIDHSAIAVSRLGRLRHLTLGFESVRNICSDIVSYTYPGKNAPLSERPSCVVLNHVVEYLAFEERIALFSKLFHSLQNNGYVYIAVDLAEGNAFEELQANEFIEINGADCLVKGTFFDSQTKHFFIRGELEKELSQVGFRDTNCDIISTYDVNETGFNSGIIIIKKHQEQ